MSALELLLLVLLAALAADALILRREIRSIMKEQAGALDRAEQYGRGKVAAEIQDLSPDAFLEKVTEQLPGGPRDGVLIWSRGALDELCGLNQTGRMVKEGRLDILFGERLERARKAGFREQA